MNSIMPKISVLMSTYREPIGWIKQSVDSIINQTYSNIEFIVLVDDPANDKLIDFLEEFAAKHSNIKVIINSKNLGLVGSINRGLTYCTGEYVARMDADDISLPNRLAEEYNYLQRNDYDLVGCGLEVFTGEIIVSYANNACSNYVCGKMLMYTNCVGHPTWLVRKEVYDKLGGYRNIDACEDYDFLMRAVLAGFKIGNIDECLLKYRDNPNSISHSKSLKQLLTANLLRKKFRNGEKLKIEEYQKWIGSELYLQDRDTYEKFQSLVTNVKKGNFTEKIKNAYHLLLKCETYRRLSNKFSVCWLMCADKVINFVL